MNADALVHRMAGFPEVLTALVALVDDDDARWRPDEAAWSIVEIVNHMADEEIEDFRYRFESTLDDPAAAWPPIDPEGVARERDYRSRDLKASLERFVAERRVSIARVRGRLEDDADLDATYVHPKRHLRAGDLLASWANHDTLHLRQIARRLHQLTLRDSGDYDTGYAGAW